MSSVVDLRVATSSLFTIPSESGTAAVAITFGLIAHQLFRRYETYSIPIHLSLVLLPPPLVLVIVPPRAFPSSAFWPIAHAYALFLSTLILSILTYRISPFHPLARYPGPLLCKLSKFWMASLSTRGHQHRYIKALHDRYGDVVRTGPNELSIRDASVVHFLLGPSGVPKGPHMVGRLLTHKHLSLIGIEDTAEHLRRRRAWNSGFSTEAVEEHKRLVVRRAQQLVKRLEDVVRESEGGREGQVRLEKWMDWFVYDAMCDMTFGGGSELLRDGDTNNVWSILSKGIAATTFFGHVPWLGVYVGYVPPATRPIRTLISRCTDLVAHRLVRGPASHMRDLLHYLNNEDADTPPPTRQVIEDGILAIVAGTDTVSSALTSILFCLLTHDEAYSRLEAEVDRVFSQEGDDDGDWWSTKSYKEMRYMDAVVNEAMRLYPPGPGGSQRRVPHAASEGITVGSLYFPPGTALSIHAYAMQRHAAYFSPHPEEFWPERWLVAAGELSLPQALSTLAPTVTPTNTENEAFVHTPAAHIPFSHGPMNCVGKNVALMEIRIVLCALIRRFRFCLPDASGGRRTAAAVRENYEREWKDYLVATRPALAIIVEVRELRKE